MSAGRARAILWHMTCTMYANAGTQNEAGQMHARCSHSVAAILVDDLV
eukprot:CAMPEP_0185185556 /NCGR_PEP_ID=MMETSP1140-20130426/3388_1 /TAXON_ID=298111 /ORGANISM="Pavlova sp., Strain CCMP459" /LENGTH=47 /DNA_ID= /DNA_START= /DNA_END= /DNA_ORIENTATION=